MTNRISEENIVRFGLPKSGLFTVFRANLLDTMPHSDTCYGTHDTIELAKDEADSVSFDSPNHSQMMRGYVCDSEGNIIYRGNV